MREIPKKNYIFLVILIVATIIITLLSAYIYNNTKGKNTSEFYNYANKLMGREFQEYVTENSDCILYLSNVDSINYEVLE